MFTSFIKIKLIFILFFVPTYLNAKTKSLILEFQVYHNIGILGSNYSTSALGFSFYLFENSSKKDRYLTILGLLIPSESNFFGNKLNGKNLSSVGNGLEIGIQDKWNDDSGKSATLAYRKIEWEIDKKLSMINDKIYSEQLHMGWNFSLNKNSFFLILLGLDLIKNKFPTENLDEINFSFGFSSNF